MIINGIHVEALIDTGSEVNGISEEWWYQHKRELGKFESLPLSNTTIKGAVGATSRAIKKQVLLEANINGMKFDMVFLIIPGLIKDCIMGIRTLRERGCIINLPQEIIRFTKDATSNDATEENSVADIVTIQSAKGNVANKKLNKDTETVNKT